MRTIILTGGGTAGHILPNIALLPYLKQNFDRIVYIGSYDGMEKQMLSDYNFVNFYPVTTVKFKRSFSPSNLKIPILLSRGKKEALEIIQRENPCVIFSKGGFVALPVVLAGKKYKVPMVAHESDLSMGLANKITKRKYSAICTTFKETAEKLPNGIYVGAPIRKEVFEGNIENARKTFNLKISKPVLTIIGGSQGSATLNQIVQNCLLELTKTHQVLHITGKGKGNPNIKNEDYHQVEFVKNMADVFSITDLCITRGGSNTLHELLALRIPMLIIPLSKSSRGDQVKNAEYFTKKGYAIQLAENKLDKSTFLNAWKTLKDRKNLIRSANQNATNNDAVEKIVKEIIKVSKK